MIFYRFIVRHWLLLMQWRHYDAFVAICSRVARRPIHDVADLHLREAFKIWYKFSTESVATYNDFLQHNTSQDERDAFLASITFNDHYLRLRHALCWTRRVTLAVCAILFPLSLLGLLGTMFLPFISLLPFIAISLIGYFLWLNLRCKRLHKLFPQACRELISYLGISHQLQSNTPYHILSLPLYSFSSYHLFSPLETLTLRSLRDFRVRQDAHAPIADKFLAIAKAYPQGTKNYILSLAEDNQHLSEVLEPLRLNHNAPLNTYQFTSLMHDEAVLDVAQNVIRNSEKVVLLSSHEEVKDLHAIISALQPSILETTKRAVALRLPTWQVTAMGAIPIVSPTQQTESLFIDHDIQQLIFTLMQNFSSPHLRTVADKKTAKFLTDRLLPHVQTDFTDLLLRKQRDPLLVTICVADKADESFASNLCKQYPLNFIVISKNII